MCHRGQVSMFFYDHTSQLAIQKVGIGWLKTNSNNDTIITLCPSISLIKIIIIIIVTLLLLLLLLGFKPAMGLPSYFVLMHSSWHAMGIIPQTQNQSNWLNLKEVKNHVKICL